MKRRRVYKETMDSSLLLSRVSTPPLSSLFSSTLVSHHFFLLLHSFYLHHFFPFKMQSAMNQSPRLLASVQRVSSSSLSSGRSLPLRSLKCSSSSASSYSTSSVVRSTLAASRPSAPRSPLVTTAIALFQQVSSLSSATTATAPRLPLLKRAFSTQMPSQDQKHATSPTTRTTPVTNDTIESLLSKSLHDQDSEAAKKKAEPGPLDGIRVLDLTRVLGMSLLVWWLPFFILACSTDAGSLIAYEKYFSGVLTD